MKHLLLANVHALQLRALASGGRPLVQAMPWSKSGLPATVEWDIAGNCTSPVARVVTGRKEVKGRGMAVQQSASVFLSVRCRKCTACLAKRSAHWRYRCSNEIAQAARTWFATFTMSPLEHGRAPMRIRSEYAKRYPAEAPLRTANGFKELSADFGRQLTLYFKRLRKATGVKLRYVLVAESHKSGLPHFHALIHEAQAEPIRHRELVSHWHLGHSSFKLVDDSSKAARYVAKYISKEASTLRMRASLAYGRLRRPGPPVGRGSEATVGVREDATRHSMVKEEISAILRSEQNRNFSSTKPKRSILWRNTTHTNLRSVVPLGRSLTFTTTPEEETSAAAQSISPPPAIQVGDTANYPPVGSTGNLPVTSGTLLLERQRTLLLTLKEAATQTSCSLLGKRRRGRIC